MTDLLVLALVLAATAALAAWWRSRDGAVRDGRPGERITPRERAALGVPDDVVVLLEFTAPGCRPCAAAKGVLEEVAVGRDGVAVAIADVGTHLDLARTHGVLRAPTTLVVGRDGVVRHRILGVPAAGSLAAVVDADASAHAA